MKRFILLFIFALLMTGCGEKSMLQKNKDFLDYTFDSYETSVEKRVRCASTGKKNCTKYTITYKDIDGKDRFFVFDDDNNYMHVLVYNQMTEQIINDIRSKILRHYLNVSEKSNSQPNDVGPSSIYVYAPTDINDLESKIMNTKTGIKLSNYTNKDFFINNKLYFALNISSDEDILRDELFLYLDAIVSDISNYMGYKINMIVSIYDEDFADNGLVSYKYYVNGQLKDIKVRNALNVYKVFESNI